MPAPQRTVTPADLIPDAEFAKQRRERRAELMPIKRLRRTELGPICTVHFETYETMLFQIQEMLLVEKGGAAQIADQLAAYNPLIPQGQEPVATILLGIEDAVRRAQMLARAQRLPDLVVACVGGGSNAAGMFHPFVDDSAVEIHGVEAAGEEGERSAPMRQHQP